MTDVLLDYAQEKFLAGKEREAFDLATSAKTLDPFFGSVDRYYTVFRVHYEATKRNKFGETDLYALLGLKGDPSLSADAISDAFCKLVKLIHPDLFCSPAAPGALRLLTKAWEVLSDKTTREAYDVRMGLRPPPPPKPRTDQIRPRHGIKKRCATNCDGDVGRALSFRRLT